MKPFLKQIFLLSFFTIGCFFVFPGEAHAIFSLSATPTREVRTIRFDQVKPGTYSRNEEVSVSVNTTVAAQYTIYQELNQPLTNEAGNTIPFGSFILFSPSSPLGTLRAQLETPVAMGRAPIYTSNAAGDSDTFVLVYNIKVSDDQPGGQYRTQIRYIAEPVNPQAGASQSVTTLDVVVDIQPKFNVSIHSANGGREIDLGHISKNRLNADGSLKIEIENNLSNYTISQQLTEPLTSAEGQSFDEENFKFMTSGGDKGNLIAKGIATQVPASNQKFYTSQSGGSDQILVQYFITCDGSQKAGVYRGTLSFKIEPESQASPEIITIPVKFEVDTLFYLDVEMPEVTKVSFGVYKTSDEKHEKQVKLTVHNNTGQAYRVTQIVSNEMMNDQGDILPPENFTYFGSNAQTGTLSTLLPVPVKKGETDVFKSNKEGSPEKFVLSYLLKTPQSPKKGSYNTNISYSISAV